MAIDESATRNTIIDLPLWEPVLVDIWESPPVLPLLHGLAQPCIRLRVVLMELVVTMTFDVLYGAGLANLVISEPLLLVGGSSRVVPIKSHVVPTKSRVVPANSRVIAAAKIHPLLVVVMPVWGVPISLPPGLGGDWCPLGMVVGMSKVLKLRPSQLLSWKVWRGHVW